MLLLLRHAAEPGERFDSQRHGAARALARPAGSRAGRPGPAAQPVLEAGGHGRRLCRPRGRSRARVGEGNRRLQPQRERTRGAPRGGNGAARRQPVLPLDRRPPGGARRRGHHMPGGLAPLRRRRRDRALQRAARRRLRCVLAPRPHLESRRPRPRRGAGRGPRQGQDRRAGGPPMAGAAGHHGSHCDQQRRARHRGTRCLQLCAHPGRDAAAEPDSVTRVSSC
mmetsp:Transcript_51444/g.123747  ORF Transcript_51444/g.123747 Transcript_51444/m.123747 type:complete len:224 (+) Transcript_51444:389-1060(+)